MISNRQNCNKILLKFYERSCQGIVKDRWSDDTRNARRLCNKIYGIDIAEVISDAAKFEADLWKLTEMDYSVQNLLMDRVAGECCTREYLTKLIQTIRRVKHVILSGMHFRAYPDGIYLLLDIAELLCEPVYTPGVSLGKKIWYASVTLYVIGEVLNVCIDGASGDFNYRRSYSKVSSIIDTLVLIEEEWI